MQKNMNRSEYDKKIISREEKFYTALIIYDIVDDKKRNRMAKLLEGYGVRVQKSAFEARLTKKHYNEMLKRASKIIDTNNDSLRTYLLPTRAYIQSWGLGVNYPQETIII